MEGNTRKYIIIPEHRPLWALGAAFGPKKGPLEEPCPVTLDVIGKLLKQTGLEKVSIYEVVKEGKGFSTPVQLNLDNYTLPYDQIAAGKTLNVDSTDMVDTTPPKSMKPNIVDTTPAAPVKEPDTPKSLFDKLAEESSSMSEAAMVSQIVKTPEPAPAPEAVVEETPAEQPTVVATEEQTPDEPAEEDSSDGADAGDDVKMDGASPYAGMTKAQRRAARRAAAQQAAQQHE